VKIAAGIQNELVLGFFLISSVPGGGLGHLIVSIAENTDAELSVTLNVLQLLIPIGKLHLITNYKNMKYICIHISNLNKYSELESITYYIAIFYRHSSYLLI